MEVLDAAAELSAARGQPHRAVRLLAGTSNLRETLRLPRTTATARDAVELESDLARRLGAAAFENERAHGRSLTFDAAIDEARGALTADSASAPA